MVNIERASLDEVSLAPKKSGLLSSLGGPQFVVAQIFTILATIVGVYLAGYVGFQRTLEYDRYVKAQQRSNLLEAMQGELTDNLTRLKEFAPKLEKSQEGQAVYQWPKLRTFVWQASAQNSALFEAPPQILTGLQAFYDEVGEFLNDNSAQEAFRHLTTSNAADRKYYTEQFEAQLKAAETKLVSALQSAAAESERVVQAYSNVGR